MKRLIITLFVFAAGALTAYAECGSGAFLRLDKPVLNNWDFLASGAIPPWLKDQRSGSTNCFNSSGVLVTLAANLPCIEYTETGAALGYRNEAAATNIVLYNRDLTNAAWTATNVTTAHNQVGIDGASNSASLLTATSAGGTLLQTTTVASTARFQTAYIKGVTVTGNIQMTMDNTTYTTLTSSNCFQGPPIASGVAINTSTWVRCQIPTQTITNPTVGFKIANNSDSIIVDFVQNETAANGPSSPIATTSGAATRVQDTTVLYGSFIEFWNRPEGALLLEFETEGAGTSGDRIISANNLMYWNISSTNVQATIRNVTTSLNASTTTAMAYGTRFAATWSPSGRMLVGSGNAAASDTNLWALMPAYSIYFGSDVPSGSNSSNIYLRKVWTWNYELSATKLAAQAVNGTAYSP